MRLSTRATRAALVMCFRLECPPSPRCVQAFQFITQVIKLVFQTRGADCQKHIYLLFTRQRGFSINILLVALWERQMIFGASPVLGTKTLNTFASAASI